MCDAKDVIRPIHKSVIESGFGIPGMQGQSFLKDIDPVGPMLEKKSGGGGGGGAGLPPLEPPTSTRTSDDLTTFTRPDAPSAIPTFLGVSSSMSPTQQLSRIATLGTQGSFGDIRSPKEGPYAGRSAADVARQYFKTLGMRSFTDPNTGAALGDATVLPVFEQYLSQGLGQPPIEGRDSLAHFLTRLSRV